jgi:hypothetical protein
VFFDEHIFIYRPVIWFCYFCYQPIPVH